MALIYQRLSAQAEPPFTAVPPVTLWQLEHPHCAFVFQSSADKTRLDTMLYTPEGSLRRSDAPDHHDAFVNTDKQWEKLRVLIRDLTLVSLPVPSIHGDFCVQLDLPPQAQLSQWLSETFLARKPNAGKRTLSRLNALYEARIALALDARPTYLLLPQGHEKEALSFLPQTLPQGMTCLSLLPCDDARAHWLHTGPLPEGSDPIFVRYDPQDLPEDSERTLYIIDPN